MMQGSVAREVPESPRQAKAKGKEGKKGREGGMAPAPARTPQTSEYAEQLKKVPHASTMSPNQNLCAVLGMQWACSSCMCCLSLLKSMLIFGQVDHSDSSAASQKRCPAVVSCLSAPHDRIDSAATFTRHLPCDGLQLMCIPNASCEFVHMSAQ